MVAATMKGRPRSKTTTAMRGRAELRVSEERKARWLAAAALTGRTLSNWMAFVCDQAAAKLLGPGPARPRARP